MAKATGTIDFSSAPAQYAKITLSDGTGDGFGQVTFAVTNTTGAGTDALSGSSALGSSNNAFNGNASKALTLYQNSSTNKNFMYISFVADSQTNADFKDMSTGGSTPLIYEFTDADGNTVNVTLINTGTFTADVSGASYARKDSAGNYSINTNNAGVDGDNIAEELKDILNAAKTAGEINITTASRDSTYYLNFRTDANGVENGPLKFRIKRASGSWTTTAKAAAHISKDDHSSTGHRIANLYAPDEPVYSVRHAPSSGGSLDGTEFAAYFASTINTLPIGITATVSGTEVSLENDVEGTAGNVTITTLGTTNASISGMSGGSASGGGSMAKRLTISAEQIAVSSSGGIASSGDNKPALMLSLTGLATQGSAADDDLLAIHVDGELVPKKIKVSELIASLAGGTDTQVQFNDSNALGGDAGLTYYKSSNALFVSGAISGGSTLSGSGEISAASFKCDGAVEAGTSIIIGSADLNETDLEKLDGITNGTAAANKAVVLDASKNIGTLGTVACGAITTTGKLSSSAGMEVVGTIESTGNMASSGSITAGTSFIIGSADLNETDLEKLDGITNGTAAASKALVLDANKNIGGITTLSASYARIDELDVVTINSVTETVNTLQIQDKLLVSALSASSAQADGGGLQVGGKQGSDTVASVLYEHTGTKMLHAIAGSTIAAVKPAGVDVTGIISGSGVATIHKVTSDGLTVNGVVSGSGTSTIYKMTTDALTVNGAAGITVNGLISGSGNLEMVGTMKSTGAIASSGSITAGSSFVIGSADLNETDLEKLDGITDGTAAGNKAVVLDASKNIATIGTIGCGVITSTGTSSFGSLTAEGGLSMANGIFSGSGVATIYGVTADNVTVGTTLSLSGSKVDAEIAAVAVGSDYFMFMDGDYDGDVKKESIKDLVTAQAGAGLQATNGVFSLSHVIDRAVATASFDSDGSAKYDYLPLSGTPSSDNCVSVYINGLHLSLSSSATGITDHWDYKIDSSRLVFSAGTDINVGDEIVIKYVAS